MTTYKKGHQQKLRDIWSDLNPKSSNVYAPIGDTTQEPSIPFHLDLQW